MSREGGRAGILAIVASALVLAACGGGRFGPVDPSPSSTTRASASSAAVEDPATALAGRAVEGLADGEDAILRIGAPGWTVADEAILDVFGDRVLSGAADGDAPARLLVRDLAGTVLREIDAGFNIPQAAIVRGDSVFFAGVQADVDADPLEAEDRGIWVARGEEPPRRILDPSDVLRYEALHLSPDGQTLGAWACGETCRAILVPDAGEVRVIERPGLTALTNDAAVLLSSWSGIAGYAVSDGSELWRHETDGTNWGRHALADGRRIVHTLLTEGDDDGRSADGYRIEVIDATSGRVELAVDIPTDEILWSLAPTLSTDRYAVLMPGVLPDAADAPIQLLVVDLADGSILDVDLALEGLGGGD